jgi:hypothetical protein
VAGGTSVAVLFALGIAFQTPSLNGLWLAPAWAFVAISFALYAHHTWKRRHPEPDRLEPRVLARQRFERTRSLEARLTD